MSAIEDFGVLTEVITARWGCANTPAAWLDITAILKGAMLALPYPASTDAYLLAMIAVERGKS